MPCIPYLDLQITFVASHPGFDGGTIYKNFLKIKTEVISFVVVEIFHYSEYRMRAIITRGLYIFYPILEDQKRFFKELFRKILPLFTDSI